jgi:hypothetical protein
MAERRNANNIETTKLKPPHKSVPVDEKTAKPPEKDADAVTSYSDYICEFRAPTKFDFTAIMKTTSTLNLCGKKLATGKHCKNENVGLCPNTGCSAHYGWQDEIEGFRLRTF